MVYASLLLPSLPSLRTRIQSESTCLFGLCSGCVLRGPAGLRANVTVAILAQGTSWAVAVTQAFLIMGSSPGES